MNKPSSVGDSPIIPKHLIPDHIFNIPKAGLDPAFVYADGYHHFALKDRIAETSGPALSESERHRLVEGSKSQTKQKETENWLKQKLYNLESKKRTRQHQKLSEAGETTAPDPETEYNEMGHTIVDCPEFTRERVPHHTPGTKTIFERRQWKDFDQFRIRTEVDTRPKVQAPEGSRQSTQLTRRAANKIADSCAFVAMERGGYSTFVTLTFTDEQRDKINSGQVTIQKEVTRALDGFKKVYERGMPKEDIPANNDTFDYCWVVEIPKNKAGEDNPHVHLMMRWKVQHHQFQNWASRLEKLWGLGFAHIEKIKNPIDAGAYMAKAAGYFTKGQEDESQGLVRGNRYGISANARAPGWELFSEAQMHVMGQLIADIKDHLEDQYGDLYDKRRSLNKRKDQINSELKSAKSIGDKPKTSNLNKQRLALGNALSKVREQIKAIPIRSNGYQVTVAGYGHFLQFVHWAQGVEGHERPEWLPEIPGGIYYKGGRRPTWEDAKDVCDMRKARRLAAKKANAITVEMLISQLQSENIKVNDTICSYAEYVQFVDKE